MTIMLLLDCRWGQVYILESLMYVVPQEDSDAETIIERITPRLQHSNSSVVLTAVKVIIYMMNYISSLDHLRQICKKLSPPLGKPFIKFSGSPFHRDNRTATPNTAINFYFESNSHPSQLGLRGSIYNPSKHPTPPSTLANIVTNTAPRLLLQIQRSHICQACKTRDHPSAHHRKKRKDCFI